MDNFNIKSAFIRKRGENYNVYIEYIDYNGKTKQKSIEKYKNKKYAEKHLIDLKSSINNNRYVIPKNITFVDRCYKYIDDNKNDWSPNTINTRNGWIKNQIKPFFTDTLLSDVSIYQVQQYANNLYKKFTVESCKTRYGFLRSVLREAYRLKEIQENPCDFVKLPSKENTFKADVYTKEEVKELIQKLDGDILEIPILLMLTLGLRRSEALGITWDDIDFKENTVSINKILMYEGSKGFSFTKPKTSKSRRVLHTPRELIVKLKKEKLRQNELILEGILVNELNLVCLNSDLKPWRPASIHNQYIKCLKKHNMRKIRMHDLRHTNATIMLLGGTNIKVVSERLGHTDIKITMNRYSHVLEEMDTQASANLSNIMFK